MGQPADLPAGRSDSWTWSTLRRLHSCSSGLAKSGRRLPRALPQPHHRRELQGRRRRGELHAAAARPRSRRRSGRLRPHAARSRARASSPSRSPTPTPSTTATSTPAIRTWTATATGAGTATCSAAAPTRRASTTTSPTRSAPGRWSSPPAGGRSPSRCSTRRGCSTSTRTGSGRKVAADGYRLDGDLHLRHPRRVGAGQPRPRRRRRRRPRASTTTGSTTWSSRARWRSSERTARCARRAIRYTEVLEPANLRQCWSSYPFVDDQQMPVLQAVDTARPRDRHAGEREPARRDARLQRRHARRSTPRTAGSPPTGSTSSARALEQQLGGVAIEMAGSVGSVESPEVYPQRDLAGPRSSSSTRATRPAAGRCSGSAPAPSGRHAHVAARLLRRDEGVRRDDGRARSAKALRLRRLSLLGARTRSGAHGRAICVPLDNALFVPRRRARRVRGHAPVTTPTARRRPPVAAERLDAQATARALEVAAFRIGDGEFISVPGEVFPFTYLRGFLGPQDMPTPAAALPPWLMPHMHAPFRFIDGLGRGHARLHLPHAATGSGSRRRRTSNPSDTDRFGCGHSDDSEAASADTADIVGAALVSVLDAHGGARDDRPRAATCFRAARCRAIRSAAPSSSARRRQTFAAAAHPARSGASSPAARRVHPKALDVAERPAAARA